MDVLINNPILIILAYAGLIIHILMKLAASAKKLSKMFNFSKYIRENRWSLLASMIMLPVLLIIATDTSLHEVLPLNNVTAVLAGWQTNSTFKSLMAWGSSKIPSEE